MSLKIRQPSSPVVNVVLGQNATHELNAGPRYHDVTYLVTISKTGLTAGAAFQPLLTDALGLMTVLVNDAERRVHYAWELDAVQTRWSPNLSVVKYDQLGNDLITAVADVVNGGNTTRTTTFVVTINFAEPSRSTFADREKFAWPTSWASGQTAKVQIKLFVPANAGVANPVITAIESIDYQLGPTIAATATSPARDSMPITSWVRQEEIYGGLKPVIRKWSFTGLLQQMSIFCQAGDDVAKAKVKSGTAIIFDDPKGDVDLLCDRHGWNPAGKSADRFDLAFDYSDNPADVARVDGVSLFELSLQLTNANAANKTLVLSTQVYLDALA